MAVGKEDFEAGIRGDALHRVYECLPNDHALTRQEIQEQTGLETKDLNIAISKLQELGYIKAKWLGAAEHYQKIDAVLPQRWFTIAEAGNYLRVSRRTIYQLIESGQLPGFRVGNGGHPRFRREDLDRVMQREDTSEMYAMSRATNPVLAELWDNEKDAEYDRL